MCRECGCGEANAHHHDGHGHEHSHVGPDGKIYFHTHDGEDAGHHHGAPRVVTLEKALLAENDRAAGSNRAFFAARGIKAFNLISSPGSGKTSLLVKTLSMLKAKGISSAVIVGDQYGEIDAERMRAAGVPVTQIQVHDACHLNAGQVASVLEQAVPEGTEIVFIENVGNLVCPVAFDLGENEKIALLSTPEGEEKPLKYPGLFAAAKLVLLTKCDIAEVLGWDAAKCVENIRSVNPCADILKVSAKTGDGLDVWLDYLEFSLKKA